VLYHVGPARSMNLRAPTDCSESLLVHVVPTELRLDASSANRFKAINLSVCLVASNLIRKSQTVRRSSSRGFYQGFVFPGAPKLRPLMTILGDILAS
jgi:hypothetical protein